MHICVGLASFDRQFLTSVQYITCLHFFFGCHIMPAHRQPGALSIMQKIITKKKLYRFLPLLVVLYIAIGLSMVHPLLHHPWNYDHSSTENCAHHHREKQDDGQASECAICKFISTSQWLATGFSPGIPTSIQFGTIASVHLSPEIDSDSRQTKPRAPPEIN